MSRIGKKPIQIPAGVDVKIDGSVVSVKGPLGKIDWSLSTGLGVSVAGGQLVVSRSSEDRQVRAMHGLTRAELSNMIQGVTKGYERNLEITLNRGDAGDLHRGGGVDAMAPGPDLHPNTDGYQGGRITVSGHTFSAISASGPTMTFCLNGCGSGPQSSDGSFAAPSGLTAAVTGSDRSRLGANSVVLTWTDNSDGSLNEDEFVIERCQETGKEGFVTCFAPHATVGRDVNTWSEPESAGTYRYRVKARRGSSEETAYSNEVRL